MSKTLQARISRIEAQIKAKPQTFDYHAAYGVDRAKFEQAMRLIVAARTHRERTYTPDMRFGVRLDSRPAPYEPQPPADWNDTARAAWPGLVAAYDELEQLTEI